MIEFHLDTRSGVAPYLQVVHQVRQALRLGLLREGDQLPTVKNVVARLAINPNTVLKAYRELEHDGLVAARPGVGTFVTRTLGDGSLAAHAGLRRELLGYHHDLGAGGQEPHHRRAPHASRAAGDDRNLSSEPAHPVSPSDCIVELRRMAGKPSVSQRIKEAPE